MNDIQIAATSIDDPDPHSRRRCQNFLAKVLKIRALDNWELSILFCDDRTIRELNRRYRHIDAVTDVLSFPQLDRAVGPEASEPATSQAGEEEMGSWLRRKAVGERVTAGDIVVSLETMRRNAKEQSIAPEEELKRLLIHGILHLEGLDHHSQDCEMTAIQERILRKMSKEKVF